MSRGTRRDDGPIYDLDPIAQAVHRDLIDEVARRAAATPTPVLRERLPRLERTDISALRNRQITGWTRLHTAAVRLGVDVAAIWAKHQRIEEAA